MTITAKIIADSTSPDNIRLTTMQLRYPRFIHAEFMTHRVFSRNASSSRAIPVERLIQDIIDDTAMPIHWGKNQKGMQADEENHNLIEYPDHIDRGLNNGRPWTAWGEARDRAVEMARAFDAAGYHKQIVNRLLEPFSHINVVVTSTDWANFFALRDHKDAQPEIQALAGAMRLGMGHSTPRPLNPGEWHLPYITEEDYHVVVGSHRDGGSTDLRKISAARCARVSYMTHDGKRPRVDADLKLYDQLMGGEIVHASPTEHQATPDDRGTTGPVIPGRPLIRTNWLNPRLHGNLEGWIQHRKLIPNENQTEEA